MLKFLLVKILFMSISASLCGAVVLGAARAGGRLFSKRAIYALWTAVIVLSLVPISLSDFNAIRNGGAMGNLSEYRTAGNFGLSALKNIGTNTAKNTAAGSAGVNVAEKSGAKTDSDGEIIGDNKNNNENTKKTTAYGSETAASGAAKARSVKGADNGNTAENTAAGADNNTAANTALSEAGAANSKTTANTGKRYIDLILNIISVMYLMTVAALGGVWIFRRVKFNAVFRRCCKRADESRLEGAKLRVGVRSKAKLYTVAASCSPFVFGVIRPKIVIPESGADDGALMHELVHIKHRDTFRLALINIAKAVHFFNPLMYIFAKETKRYMELACDEEVSSLLSGAERVRYSAEIVRSAAGFARGGVCLSENAENIKERIDSVMNGKIYKRSVRIVGAIAAAALIAVQTAFAAGVNSGAPVRSYAVNGSRRIYSIIYTEGETIHYAVKAADTKGSASLVNTAVFKGFSADLYTEFSRKLNSSDKESTAPSAVHVEMTKFIKEYYGGRAWQGLFTVTINGEVFTENAKGYLSEVPGGGARGFARLWIDDRENGKTFEIEHIDFYLGSESVIDAEYEENAAESFDADFERTVSSKNSLTWNGKKYSYDSPVNTTIRTNSKEGLLDINELTLPQESGNYISSVPGEKYTFSGDSVSGKFFLRRYGAIILDEFDATLSGFKSGKMTFTSTDKKINWKMKVKNAEKGILVTGGYDPDGQDEVSVFMKTSTQYPYKRIRLSDLPFTLTMNEEKTGLILKIKDGFDPEGWYYSYSSYIGDDTDVYTKYHSKYGKRETFLPFAKSYGTHNLQFTYYSTNPYYKNWFYDICFRVEDGETLYHGCTEYLTENKNYSGERAKYFMEYLHGPDFPDEEIKYY